MSIGRRFITNFTCILILYGLSRKKNLLEYQPWIFFYKSVFWIFPGTHTHTHTRLMALFPRLPGSTGTRKVKPIWILLEQETVSGSGISWAICKSAFRSRQITMPAPHQSVFYRPDALPAAQPTASKHWRHKDISWKSPANWLGWIYRHPVSR